MNKRTSLPPPITPSICDPLLHLPAVLHATGFGRSTFYSRIARQLFTPPVRLGLRRSAWPATEIHRINRAMIAGVSDSELRELVKALISLRSQRE